MRYRGYNLRGAIWVLVFLTQFLFACDSSDNASVLDFDDRVDESELNSSIDASNAGNIVFGFDLRASPQEDAKQYLPFIKYLEAETGLHFKIRFTPNSSSIADDLGNDVVQFAAIGAVSFLLSNEKYGVMPLVRGLNDKGKSEYQSMFVVRSNSSMKKLSDIRGKRLVFGSQHSTQGSLIPRIVLADNKIGLNELTSHQYTGSHQNCASAVIAGAADVCGMQDTMAQALVKEGLLKVLYTSDYYPSSGIAVNKNVSAEIIAKVKQAMLDFKPQGKNKEGLYHWERTEMPMGFSSAQVKDYEQLKIWSMRLDKAESRAGDN